MVLISAYKYYTNSDPQSQNRFEIQLTQGVFFFLPRKRFFKKSGM